MRVETSPHPIAAKAMNVDGGNNFEEIVAGIWQRIYL